MKIRPQRAEAATIRDAADTAVEPQAATQAPADRFGPDTAAFADFVGHASSSDVSAQLERWDQMHRSVPSIPLGEARLKMTWALSDPMWPALKAMGFKPSDAYAIWCGLRSDAHFRKTSVGVSFGTTPDAEKLKSLTAALKAGTGPAHETLESNVRRLESELTKYISDNPADLVEHPEVQAALETVVLSHATLLLQSDKDSLQSYRFHEHRFGTLSAFTMLRELSILDPAQALVVGRAYTAALRDAQSRANESTSM